MAERTADGAAERGTDLAEQVTEEALRGELRRRLERQEALRELTGVSADGVAESLIAERATDDAAERRAVLAEQIADKALRCQLLRSKQTIRHRGL
ncbi:hypothetical protein SSBR45R_56240 [Bradyrhizobium sp. SSBR45R]|nr:hypothetical protein SSBR45R_56240 [Bradyrhizobium sp. SSBR45R]